MRVNRREPSSGQRLGGQHVTQHLTLLGRDRVTHPSAMQAARGSSRDSGVGLPGVVDDPLHHLGEVGTFGEDRGAFDDLSTGRVRTRETRQQSAYRRLFHPSHHSPMDVTVPAGGKASNLVKPCGAL